MEFYIRKSLRELLNLCRGKNQNLIKIFIWNAFLHCKHFYVNNFVDKFLCYRKLLDISPQSGSKKSVKSNKTCFDIKVMALVQSLADYEKNRILPIPWVFVPDGSCIRKKFLFQIINKYLKMNQWPVWRLCFYWNAGDCSFIF